MVDSTGILPEQLGSHALVQVGFDRLGTKEGFSQSTQSFIRMDMQPEQVGKLRVADCFKRSDFHDFSRFNASTSHHRHSGSDL